MQCDEGIGRLETMLKKVIAGDCWLVMRMGWHFSTWKHAFTMDRVRWSHFSVTVYKTGQTKMNTLLRLKRKTYLFSFGLRRVLVLFWACTMPAWQIFVEHWTKCIRLAVVIRIWGEVFLTSKSPLVLYARLQIQLLFQYSGRASSISKFWVVAQMVTANKPWQMKQYCIFAQIRAPRMLKISAIKVGSGLYANFAFMCDFTAKQTLP